MLPSVDFRCLLRWHLGIPQSLMPLPLPPCPKCGQSMDAEGHHAVCCTYNGISRRHNAIQDSVHRLLMQAGFPSKKEQSTPEGERPGDVFVSRLDANGPAAIDVTIRHTLAPSRPVQKGAAIEGWHQEQERQKKQRYSATCARRRWTFIPLTMDCYGGMGPEGRHLMATCMKYLQGQRDEASKREIEASTWQAISMSLAREIGRQLRLYCLLVTPDSSAMDTQQEGTGSVCTPGPPEVTRESPGGLGGTAAGERKGAHRPYHP